MININKISESERLRYPHLSIHFDVAEEAHLRYIGSSSMSDEAFALLLRQARADIHKSKDTHWLTILHNFILRSVSR